MRSRGEFIAIERLMREGSNSPYDNGVNGIFEACRTCHFHRPYSSIQTCVFPTCPYSICRVSDSRDNYRKEVKNEGSILRMDDSDAFCSTRNC